MNTKLTKLIERAKSLPEERQEALADTMASFFEEERYQHARTLEGLAEAERGEGVDEAEARERMKAFVGRHV